MPETQIAKITIKDETRCYIEGVDLKTRKELVKKFSYEKPGARFSPAVKLGRWNGKTEFCTLAANTYINLLPDIIPMLDVAGYDIQLEDLRTYQTAFSIATVCEDSFADHVWPEGHPFAGEPIMLRDYQVAAINRFANNSQGIQNLPTSSGKTIITAVLSYLCQPHGRTIVIVPNTDLVKQTRADYENLKLDVGVYHGDEKSYGKTHTICTWQSLNSLYKQTQDKVAEITIYEFLAGVTCVICDEVHGAKADVLLTLLNGPLGKIPIRWGITGTIPKEEYAQKALQVSFGDIIGSLTAAELQERGVLSTCDIHILQLEDYGTYKEYTDEYDALVGNRDRNEFISEFIAKIRSSGNTLVLVNRVEQGKAIAKLIPDAVFVSGKTDGDKRKKEYDSVLNATDKVIIATYGVAAVGLNIVRLHNIVLIEVGKSFTRVIQSIGRGLRKGFDKDHVDIYDICSSLKFSKRQLTERKKFYKEVGYPFVVEKHKWK